MKINQCEVSSEDIERITVARSDVCISGLGQLSGANGSR